MHLQKQLNKNTEISYIVTNFFCYGIIVSISKFHFTLPFYYADIPQLLLRYFDVNSKLFNCHCISCYFDLQILHYFIKTGQHFQRSIWYPSSCNIIFHKSMNGCGEYPRSVCLFGSPILWCCYVKASSPFLFSFEGYQENLK